VLAGAWRRSRSSTSSATRSSCRRSEPTTFMRLSAIMRGGRETGPIP
jgi:hypothetical protein